MARSLSRIGRTLKHCGNRAQNSATEEDRDDMARKDRPHVVPLHSNRHPRTARGSHGTSLSAGGLSRRQSRTPARNSTHSMWPLPSASYRWGGRGREERFPHLAVTAMS